MSLKYPFHLSLSTPPQRQKSLSSEADEDEDEDPGLIQSAQLFAPKSLVLVSRLDHTEAFRVQMLFSHRPLVARFSPSPSVLPTTLVKWSSL